MRIISLTSIPPRFPYLKKTLASLVAQNAADEIRLYLAKKYRRFPEYDGELPEVPDGVLICQVEEDLGPATKILPACRDFRGQDVQILFCDDDGLFPRGWAKQLFETQAKRTSEAVATWGRSVKPELENGPLKSKYGAYSKYADLRYDLGYRFGQLLNKLIGYVPLRRPIGREGYADLLFGVCGVVVKPDFFDDEAYAIPDEAWFVDDIWLSAQLARRDIPIYCPSRFPCPRSSDAVDLDSLLSLEMQGAARQELNRKAAQYCQKKYGIWKG